MKLEKELSRAIERRSPPEIERVFEKIYNKYAPPVGCVISKYVLSAEDVEDLVDEVFLYFSQRMFKNDIRNIGSYLASCAKGLAINFAKLSDNVRQVDYVDECQFDFPSDDNSAYYSLVKQMQTFLSPFQINVVLLHGVYGYSMRELGKKYHKPIGSIGATYSRALKQIRKHMGDDIL